MNEVSVVFLELFRELHADSGGVDENGSWFGEVDALVEDSILGCESFTLENGKVVVDDGLG